MAKQVVKKKTANMNESVRRGIGPVAVVTASLVRPLLVPVAAAAATRETEEEKGAKKTAGKKLLVAAIKSERIERRAVENPKTKQKSHLL